jgi:hypothetical protein
MTRTAVTAPIRSFRPQPFVPAQVVRSQPMVPQQLTELERWRLARDLHDGPVQEVLAGHGTVTIRLIGSQGPDVTGVKGLRTVMPGHMAGS